MLLRICLVVICLQLVSKGVDGTCDLNDDLKDKMFWHYDDETGDTEQLISFTNSIVKITSISGATLERYDCLISSESLPTWTLLLQETGGSRANQLCVEILRHRDVMAIRKVAESGQSRINQCVADFELSTDPFFIYIEYDGGLVYNDIQCPIALYDGLYGLEYTLREGGSYTCRNNGDSEVTVSHDTETVEIASCRDGNTYYSPFTMDFVCLTSFTARSFGSGSNDYVVILKTTIGGNDRFYCVRYRTEDTKTLMSFGALDETRTICLYSQTADWARSYTDYNPSGRFIQFVYQSNACARKRPCQNGGTCTDMRDSPGYTCDCRAGFSGYNCEININECASRPCQNGGTCVDGINRYTCECDETSYRGTHCEIALCPFASKFEGEWLVGYDRSYRSPVIYDIHDDVYEIQDAGDIRTCQEAKTSNGIMYMAWQDDNQRYGCAAFQIVEGLLFFKETDPSNTQRTANNCQSVLRADNNGKSIGIAYAGGSVDSSREDVPFTQGGYHVTINEAGDLNQCQTEVPSDASVEDEVISIDSCVRANTYEQPFRADLEVFAVIDPDDLDDSGDDIMILGKGYPRSNAYAFYPARYKEEGIAVDVSVGIANENSWVLEEGRRASRVSADYTTILLTSNRCDALLPCENGGTCTDLMQDYECECLPGYTGTNCEIDINDCSGKPCGDHGTCVDETSGFSCDCDDNWSGDLCTVFDYCSSSPCLNRGTCSNRPNTFNCACRTGYTGDRCETEINECASEPCLNDGTCVDRLNGYTCVCPSGTTGDYCHININECESRPCQNGGTCRDRIDGYYCFCTDEYIGVHCEHYNECHPKPCQNGGLCEDDLGFYTCYCTPGWEGENCETQGDCPCLNGGNCTSNSFTCVCPEGYSGTYCGDRAGEFICNTVCQVLVALTICFIIGCLALVVYLGFCRSKSTNQAY